MKHKKMVLVCVIVLLITFGLGFLIGISINNNDDLKYKKVNVAGTYRTNTWNGKEAVLVLKDTMACMYPNNSNKCEWSLSEDIVRIIISKEVNEDCNIKVYMKDNITPQERSELNSKLQKIQEIDGLYLYELDNMIMVETKECSQIDKVYNEIGAFENIKHLDKHDGGIKIEHTEHIAALIDGGLMLEGHFFEKIK